MARRANPNSNVGYLIVRGGAVVGDNADLRYPRPAREVEAILAAGILSTRV